MPIPIKPVKKTPPKTPEQEAHDKKLDVLGRLMPWIMVVAFFLGNHIYNLGNGEPILFGKGHCFWGMMVAMSGLSFFIMCVGIDSRVLLVKIGAVMPLAAALIFPGIASKSTWFSLLCLIIVCSMLVGSLVCLLYYPIRGMLGDQKPAQWKDWKGKKLFLVPGAFTLAGFMRAWIANDIERYSLNGTDSQEQAGLYFFLAAITFIVCVIIAVIHAYKLKSENKGK